MKQDDKSGDVWPSNRWQDRVKRFFGAPVKPPMTLSVFVPDLVAFEREVARLGTEALNFEDNWRFEPMGQWSYKPLWFYLYQVQAYRQSSERCRAVLDVLMRYGANMRDLYRQPELLGSFAPHNSSFAFIEIQAARARRAAQRHRDEKIQAVELIKAGGGELHPSFDGQYWSSSPGGPCLELAPNTPQELMICGLLNDGLLEGLPGKWNPQMRRESAFRLTATANKNLASATDTARVVLEQAQRQAKRA